MHVLHVVRSVAPAHGGVAEAVIQASNGQRLIGDTVEILCQDDPQSPFLANIPYVVHALGLGKLGNFKLSFRLWSWLHEHATRFDGIVVHGVWSFANLAVGMAARRSAVPFLIFPHGSLDPWFCKSYPIKGAGKRLYWPLQRAVLRDAAAVVFTSETERDLAAKGFPRRDWNSAVAPIGICEPEGEPQTQSEHFYKQLPALRNRRYLLSLARICEKKGCDLLIRAFAKVAQLEPTLDVVIAGPDEGGLRAKLQRHALACDIAHRVHWPGILQGDAKWGALRNAEAFILPSHQENFGIAIVQALAVGRPVLISNQVNIWTTIDADKAGFVDDDSEIGTLRLIERWLRLTEVERRLMSVRAYECFGRHFSIEQSAATFRTLFQYCTTKDPTISPSLTCSR